MPLVRRRRFSPVALARGGKVEPLLDCQARLTGLLLDDEQKQDARKRA
jgi:hypothetical protein